MPNCASVRRGGKGDASAVPMVSIFSDAGYLMRSSDEAHDQVIRSLLRLVMVGQQGWHEMLLSCRRGADGFAQARRREFEAGDDG